MDIRGLSVRKQFSEAWQSPLFKRVALRYLIKSDRWCSSQSGTAHLYLFPSGLYRRLQIFTESALVVNNLFGCCSGNLWKIIRVTISGHGLCRYYDITVGRELRCLHRSPCPKGM